MINLFDIRDRVVVVTGATGTLAGSIADYLAGCGARVAYLGRTQEKLDAALTRCREKTPSAQCIGLVADVLDRPALEMARDQVLQHWGRIDGLFNGAGGNMPGATIPPEKHFADLDFSSFEQVVDLNLHGTVLPCLVFSHDMISAGRGSIINCSSVSAVQTVSRVVGYSAAKAAVENFTRWLGVELARKTSGAVRVNALMPGFFVGEQNRRMLFDEEGSLTERGSLILQNTPFGRLGQADELHGAVHYLLADASQFVTGSILTVDGGFTAFSGGLRRFMTDLEIAANPQTRYRWVICGLLFFATTINYVDRQILSLLKPILDDQLHWTSTQFGAINSAFQAAYGISLITFGWLIDRFGTKRGYAVSITAWSVAAISHALVNSIGGFFGARIALGLGEGGNFPAAIKATAQWFPKKERALATSLFNSGANVGAILAPAVVPAIAYHLGWHWAFIFAGLAGFAWLAFWFPLFDYPEKSRRVSPAELFYIESDSPDASAGSPATWGDLLKHQQAWSFIAAKFFTDPVWWFFLIWLPDFFKKTRHLDIKSSWTLLVGIYSIITVLSIFGGWLSGHLVSKGWRVTTARKLAMAIFALCVIPIAGVTHVSNGIAVLLLGLAGAAHQAWSATLYTTVSDMFPKRMVAKLIGAGSAAGSLGGMGFPLLTGYLLDHYANGYAIVFAFCGSAYVLAFCIHHLLAPSFEQVLPASTVTITA